VSEIKLFIGDIVAAAVALFCLYKAVRGLKNAKTDYGYRWNQAAIVPGKFLKFHGGRRNIPVRRDKNLLEYWMLIFIYISLFLIFGTVSVIVALDMLYSK